MKANEHNPSMLPFEKLKARKREVRQELSRERAEIKRLVGIMGDDMARPMKQGWVSVLTSRQTYTLLTRALYALRIARSLTKTFGLFRH